MRLIKLITKSVLAGVLIALAGIVYLNCSDKFIGSFLFSFGLCLVLLLEANLFTGKVGYLKSKKDVLDLTIMFVINIITAFLVGLIAKNGSLSEAAAVVTKAKLNVFYNTW